MEAKNRLTWNDYFSKIVEVTAERSSCKRLQVGCLLVKDNRIISQGYLFHVQCMFQGILNM